MILSERIYLDNAATSFPKPDAVYRAVDHYQREIGTSVGRGATRKAVESQQIINRCRMRAARVLGCSRPEQIIFTYSGTDSLNLAIQGILRPGDRVVTSGWEHNSVLRPLQFLAANRNVEIEFIEDDGQGGLNLESLSQLLRRETRLVVLTHASNVTGIVQPAEEVISLAHAAGAFVLLDAAQTAGHLPVSMEKLQADLIACPGHKGLMGPLGTGLLAIREGLEKELNPLRQGGTGTTSESEFQPDTLPEKYEPGNHNASGLAGLEAALAWHEDRSRNIFSTSHETASPERALIGQLISELAGIPGVHVHYGNSELPRVGVASLTFDRMAPQVAAALLDEHFGIETRAGLHCAPRAHATMGTSQQGGTVRFSTGPFTTEEHIAAVLEAIAQIAVAL
jgi:cysteine desulfurase family protein